MIPFFVLFGRLDLAFCQKIAMGEATLADKSHLTDRQLMLAITRHSVVMAAKVFLTPKGYLLWIAMQISKFYMDDVDPAGWPSFLQLARRDEPIDYTALIYELNTRLVNRKTPALAELSERTLPAFANHLMPIVRAIDYNCKRKLGQVEDYGGTMVHLNECADCGYKFEDADPRRMLILCADEAACEARVRAAKVDPET